jgi:DNA-binding MarR family transcriptional regulator
VVEQELGVLYRRAAATSRAMSREVHPDLEGSAYGLLVRIDAVPGIRLTDLAAYFGINKSSVSRQVALLEQLGLVDRLEDPTDGRASGLTLTADGNRRLEAARMARRGRFRGLLSKWPDEDIAELGHLLARYNRLYD